MSKLRVVKDRKSTKGHESDLRGLGEDKSLLNDVVPLPVLSLKTADTGKEGIEELCKSLPFNVVLSYESSVLHITPSSPVESFKEDLIDLFGLMLVLEVKVKASYEHAQLWLWDRMRERVRGNRQEVTSTLKKSYKTIVKSTEAKVSSLQSGTAIYLRQAGFSVPRSIDAVELTNTMLSSNIQILQSNTVEHKQFKAGGDS